MSQCHEAGMSGSRAPNAADAALGHKLRELRRARDMTQKDLGALVGITGAQLHRYEMGLTRVTASRVVALADALGVQPESLMGLGKTGADQARRDAAVERMAGISLRDWFAGQALAGMMADPGTFDMPAAGVARSCFALADAMLARRAQEPGA